MASSMRRIVSLAMGPLVAGSVLAACFSGAGPSLLPDRDAAPGGIGLGEDDAGLTRTDGDIGDSFAITGLTPSHGPFGGGTRVQVDGRGFSSTVRFFVGGIEMSGGSVLASDPTRAALIMPKGTPGFVDVEVRDDATAKRRVLSKAFFYDAFGVLPDSGATSGGTRIAITGSGTAWEAGTTVAIGGVPCNDVVVTSPTKVECVTPASTPGSKDVVVTAPAGPPLQARDAYTYSDSTDGYRGGLSGGALSGRVKVLGFDLATGMPLPGAFAIAGGDLASAKVAKTSASGVVEIDGIVGDKVTVTVAAKCHQPFTFVDVPVDTVTAYLAPVMDPACAEGDPVFAPGRQRYGGLIEGQLVFPGAGEFERAGWTTVPLPTKPTERRAAYVFEAAGSPNQPFQLPPASEAITPDAEGAVGYGYSLLVFPGNATIYVVAGLEDRSESPPKFVPYAMGVARGVAVPAQSRVQGVDVKMDVLFDHRVDVSADVPAPGPRGPDRFTASIATTLGAAGFAILPRGTRTTATPPPSVIPFIGVPALDRALAEEQYVLGGSATTGPDSRLPASVVSRVRTTNANTPVSLGGFLGAPVLAQPGVGVWGGKRVEYSGASGPVDLSVTEIVSGGGLVTWTVVAPAGATSFDLPDLSALPGPDPVGLVRGAISTTIYVARAEQLDYGRLRYGQLGIGAWTAYAADRLGGVY